MAATVAVTRKEHAGSSRIAEGTVTLDSTYVNGTGEAVTAAAMGLRTVESIQMDPTTATCRPTPLRRTRRPAPSSSCSATTPPPTAP